MKRLLFVLPLLLCACQPQTRSEPKKEKEVRLNLSQNPLSIDPRIGGDRRSQIITRMLFEGLVHVAADGSLKPALAKEIHLSKDNTRYTFVLRDATWTDGSPITAHDFEYSWKAILRPDFPSAFSVVLYAVKGAREAKKGEIPLSEVGIHAASDKILIVDLDHPAPYFLHCVANGLLSPVPVGIDEKNPRWSHKVESFVSSGPFKLVRWDQDSQVEVVRNPHYWDAEAVHLDRIVLSIMGNARSVLDLFERGELHWAGEPFSELPLEAITLLRRERKLHAEPVLGVYRYEMNTENPPFNSAKIRQAFAYAIDRASLVQHVLHGEESIAHSLLPAHLSLQKKPVFASLDETYARELFEEGLKEEGWTRETMPKVVLNYTALTGEKALAQAVQQQWQNVFSISVELACWEWNTFLARTISGTFQIVGATWYSWYDDPIYNLEALKHSGERYNPTRWQHPDFIAALDASDRAPSTEMRQTYLKMAEDIALEQVPVIPVFTAHYKYVCDPCLKGVVITKPGFIDFTWADLIE